MEIACFNFLSLSTISDIANVVIAACVLFVTIAANSSIKKSQKYVTKQFDRKIIEELFFAQEDVEKAFFRDGNFKNADMISKLVIIREKARLYDLIHIRLNIEKIIEVFNKGYVLHSEIYDDPEKSNVSIKPKISEYYALIKKAHSYFQDIECYRNHLKVSYS